MPLSEVTDEHAAVPASDANGASGEENDDVDQAPEVSAPLASIAPEATPRISTCYSMALELDAFVARTAAEAPRTHAWLADHAQRASATLVLHLTESVRHQGDDRLRFLAMARAAALEVDAVLTLLANRGVCTRRRRAAARDATMRLVDALARASEA